MNIKRRLNNLAIVSPCSIDWQDLSGDDRIRYCSDCNLHVHNFAAMTSGEIDLLMQSDSNRVCGRITRFEGAIITKDSKIAPINLMKGFATFALVAVMGYFTTTDALAQSSYQDVILSDTKSAYQEVILPDTTTQSLNGAGAISGNVMDLTGAVISDTNIKLINQISDETFSTQTNEFGKFLLTAPPGTYRLLVEANGFSRLVEENIVISQNEKQIYDIGLTVGLTGDIVCIDEKPAKIEKITFAGVVYKDQQQVISNAKIILTNANTADKFSTKANKEGKFSIKVPVGIYKLSISFKNAEGIHDSDLIVTSYEENNFHLTLPPKSGSGLLGLPFMSLVSVNNDAKAGKRSEPSSYIRLIIKETEK